MGIDNDSLFLRQRVCPYGQHEDVLKALNKMETDFIISRVILSLWALRLCWSEGYGRTSRISVNYRLTLIRRLRRYAPRTMKPEDFMKWPQFKPLIIIATPLGLF